jgi:hypothetical protein
MGGAPGDRGPFASGSRAARWSSCPASREATTRGPHPWPPGPCRATGETDPIPSVPEGCWMHGHLPPGGGRLLVGLTVMLLLTGCAGSANPPATPAVTTPTSVPTGEDLGHCARRDDNCGEMEVRRDRLSPLDRAGPAALASHSPDHERSAGPCRRHAVSRRMVWATARDPPRRRCRLRRSGPGRACPAGHRRGGR